MSIRAELIYIAEEIAEEYGEDHAWVTQLRDLSEEVDDYNGLSADDFFISGHDGGIGGNGISGFMNQMQQITSQAIGVKNIPKHNHNKAAKYKVDIIDAWKKRNKNKSETDIGNRIADSFQIDQYYVWEIINEYEKNHNAPVSKYYNIEGYLDLIIQDWEGRNGRATTSNVCDAIAKKYNLAVDEVFDVIKDFQAGKITSDGKRI